MARRRRAVVDVDVAVGAGVAGQAGAGEAVNAVHAGCAVPTRVHETFVDVVLTIGS